MNQIFLEILLNPWKNCKNIRNYAAEQQKCPKTEKMVRFVFEEEKKFQGKFMTKFIIFFLNILRPNFQNSFVPFFSVLSSMMEQKKLLKTKHQCKTSVK